MNDTQTIDSSRKRGVLKKSVSICQTNLRYDRNGKEIRIGAKYSITINPDILYHPAEQHQEQQLQQNQQHPSNMLNIQNNETDLLTQTSSQRNSQPRQGSRESKERLFDQMIDKTQRRKGKKKACCTIF
ncbi:hypothetical protein pb186bvf_011590 [Paramecium bursaria]